MAELRDYQQRTINSIFSWFEKNPNGGNPVFVLPTGAGKSHVIAALCKIILQNWPDQSILMLTHVKELIEQNAKKMREHWPNAPMGIYSAGLGQRTLGEPITFAGIQSVKNKADDIGVVDIIIIDECHLLNNSNQGAYRQLIGELKEINPQLRVIGFTATPYRLGQGLLTSGKEALFDDIIEEVFVEELIRKGHLATLKSKLTNTKIDVSGVKKRGGEYIASELEQAVDNSETNRPIVDEIIYRAEDRKAWLIFCVSVDHARHLKDELLERGISAETITGATKNDERERILNEFKSGKIRALTNCSVLTTGFDYPDIDLLAMCRPTCSPGLYVQMAGRGLRLKSHTDHCLVLDFAGVVEMHGPITAVRPPSEKKEGDGEAPSKACPECGEIVHASIRSCPACGFVFEPPQGKMLRLNSNIDIMGRDLPAMEVESWRWSSYTGRSGKPMIRISYTGAGLADPVIHEYLTVSYPGYAGQKAMQRLMMISRKMGVFDDLKKYINEKSESMDLEFAVSEFMSMEPPPASITYQMDGKFHRVIDYDFGLGRRPSLAGNDARPRIAN
jgi:DNA repair protein RadD